MIIKLLSDVILLASFIAVNWIWSKTYRSARRELDNIRMATYELTKMHGEDIADLQDALKEAGIPLPRPRMEERMRWHSLTPEQRETESMERFEAAVAESHRLIKEWEVPDVHGEGS